MNESSAIAHSAKWFALAIVCLVLPACAESGKVLERGTDRPLPGVFVISEWRGVASVVVQSRLRCYAAEVTTTDEVGRFSVSWFSGNLNPVIMDRHQSITVYKPGFRRSHLDTDKPGVIYMEPRTGTSQDIFADVARKPLGSHCEGALQDRTFAPVWRARALEAQSLATTDKEHYTADSLLLGAEILEIGEDAAGKKFDLRQAARARAKSKEVAQ